MKKIKQIDYDKMLALLELGIPADAWSNTANKLRVQETLVDMSPSEVERALNFYTNSTSGWTKERSEDGGIVCYTLVEADDDEES